MQNQDQHHAPRARQTTEETARPQHQSQASTQSAPMPFRHSHSEAFAASMTAYAVASEPAESWIEIGSRPSSSSLSSAADEIVTTGLRVQHDSNSHRRRLGRPRAASRFQIGTGLRATSGGNGSSQEEYEESESESDRVMTSSNEGIGPSPLQHELRRPSRHTYSVASSETMSERDSHDEDDDDENATAVNYPRSARPFEPRPNAFSHGTQARSASGRAYPAGRGGTRPPSQRQHSYPQHSPYSAVSPAYQADHDEALRASLSTLLSAAAAVRGLPKPGQSRTTPTNGASGRVDPTTLRFVPESVALGEDETNAAPLSAGQTHSSISSPRTRSTDPSDKPKRKAIPSTHANMRGSSKDRHANKKARRTGPLVEEISPTLLTWVVSAGVVVLVSALSFSAGYVVGKEAGHAEAMSQLGAAGSEAGRCSQEAASGFGRAGMGLKRLRWSGGSGVRV